MIWIVIIDYFIYIVCNTKWLEGAVSCNAFRITFIIWRSLKPFVDTCWETIGWCLGGRSWRQGPDDCSYVVTRGLVFILSRAGNVLRYPFRRKFCESWLRKYRYSVAQTKHMRKWSSFEHFVSDPFSKYIWCRLKQYIANFASLDRLLSTFENNFIWWSMNLKTSQKHRPCDGLAKNCIVDDGKFNPITTDQFEHI